jgi:hypothetical protein
MILLGFSLEKLVIGVLLVSISLLILIIIYRKLLAHLGKGNLVKENYCVLYGLENPIVTGEVEFYFTSEEAKKVALEILDEDMKFFHLIVEKEFEKGGNIIRFDSSQLKNGNYYYQLRTDNQKTMKKIRVQHPEN